MSVTIHEVLGELRASALDERDKGDKFERLVQSFLRTDPEWTAKFDDVWTWTEWPERGTRTDTGIDLVAKVREADTFAAIQCKFYDEHRTVAKGDIDSFLSASSKAEFSARYIFDTAKGWSKNADETLEGQMVPVQRVDIGYMEDAGIDWSVYSWSTPEVLPTTGPKTLRPHQSRALDDVRRGLATADRGRMIMACGTGKTFTSLRIAEDLVGVGGSVLFLVPSIQLMSQSLREWMVNREIDIRPFAVCSDVRVGRKTSDDADLSTVDLTEPATTDAATLAARMGVGRHSSPRMTVVFATYQSIDVVAEAQRLGVPGFDLVICDEAHRTTGVTLAGQDESHFVKVHDGDYLKADRRLYMTATPRVFGDAVRKKATDAEALLADMSDETIFGPELHRLGFGDAVEADLLTDYKVLVLSVDESYVAEHFQSAMAQSGEIALGDAAKLIGCWNGLRKHFGPADTAGDDAPMRRAVAFAKDIKASKLAAGSFPVMVDRARQDETDHRADLRVEARHVDGTMGIHERNTHLAWLKEEPPADACRVLTNARCLSEGVDVPALDAVLFLTPRGSQVDVVQSVGRVMRKAPGKQLGYIVLPIVVPSGVAPEEALRDNERYKVVWQVLQALRSHDERFHAMINQIELNKRKPDRLRIIDVTPRPDRPEQPDDPESEQLALDYGFDGFRDAMYARIVQKVGERKYWETWAKDVADIAQAHITRINGLLKDPESNPAKEFEEFLAGLRGNLNEGITRDEAIEMLAQHLITRPIFEVLFDDFDFTAHNPVARTMELMLASLDEHNLAAEQSKLDRFYDSVRRRADGLDNAHAKQRVIVELYDRFFSAAFSRTVDRLGIVYTPVEIVDFILQSADQVLRAEFGQGLTDRGVHVLDGFAGTGTFLTRLLMSDLIEPHDLARKYAYELHANEMVLLAYYIAAVNIETIYADVRRELAPVLGEEHDDFGDTVPTYEPFPGLVLTDTFQSYEDGDRDDLDIFPENNERIARQRELPITVILGNPPYSVGQDSANDDNANQSYPTIDAAIRDTYAARSNAKLLAKIYDSYIRAIKWASLRIKDRGVIAFVTNGGWLDANSADGMRLSLSDEFSAIHVLNLRGNQRTAGEQSRREGGKIFGGGSRATVAVTVLVKKPDHAGPATIRYTDIGDYLSREEKLEKVAEAKTLAGLESATLQPNAHGDWLNLRADDYPLFTALVANDGVLRMSGLGVGTARDAYVYGSSRSVLARQVQRHIEFYMEHLGADEPPVDLARGSWGGDIRKHLSRGRQVAFDGASVRSAMYRPFMRQWRYLDPVLNNRVGVATAALPTEASENLGFYVLNPGADKPWSALMVPAVPDLAFFGSNAGHLMLRWTWEPVEEPGTLPFSEGHDDGGHEVVDGYRRVDNVTDEALRRWQAAYGSKWTKDDVFFYVYGLLHSPGYRERYASDLKKMLPRIPLVSSPADARAFADGGRALSELHIGYESVAPYPLQGLDAEAHGDPYDFFAVGDRKMRFGKPSAEQKVAGERADRSVIHYNDRITLSGIPEDAYRYQLGSRSAVEWIIDRYWVKTDKASGIVNDPNDWSREISDPRYIIDLLARVVTVSIETMLIVDALPPLVLREEQ
ncbi:type ISP restriction/modification enzyme [Nocardioides sp. S-58]|uniref:Type ISP restriction/modification enzyme n=1 Tax=Nocardioides renjunii TaxID=3095075 RepID=A0ABU5KBK9_9ACTN|nr:type ISP restriction/modification enzyme [Nocardioides sp. S-58]MDZ5662354.1 type ISP restriction/modification enzyme [Nocardioides sp. S-58]